MALLRALLVLKGIINQTRGSQFASCAPTGRQQRAMDRQISVPANEVTVPFFIIQPPPFLSPQVKLCNACPFSCSNMFHLILTVKSVKEKGRVI